MLQEVIVVGFPSFEATEPEHDLLLLQWGFLHRGVSLARSPGRIYDAIGR